MPAKGQFKSNAKARSKRQRSYQGQEEQKKNRAARNKARNEKEKKGTAHKGDGKDVGHKKALANGGSKSTSNTKMQSRSSTSS